MFNWVIDTYLITVCVMATDWSRNSNSKPFPRKYFTNYASAFYGTKYFSHSFVNSQVIWNLIFLRERSKFIQKWLCRYPQKNWKAVDSGVRLYTVKKIISLSEVAGWVSVKRLWDFCCQSFSFSVVLWFITEAVISRSMHGEFMRR